MMMENVLEMSVNKNVLDANDNDDVVIENVADVDDDTNEHVVENVTDVDADKNEHVNENMVGDVAQQVIQNLNVVNPPISTYIFNPLNQLSHHQPIHQSMDPYMNHIFLSLWTYLK